MLNHPDSPVLFMPKLTRILLVILKVNECGTNLLQRMLLQENLHQVAGMNTLVLKAIWQLLRRKQQNKLFSNKGFAMWGRPEIEGCMFVRSM
jgi:hypothetical protein